MGFWLLLMLILSCKCCVTTEIPRLNQLHYFNHHCTNENELVQTLFTPWVLLLVLLTEIESNYAFHRSYGQENALSFFFPLLVRSPSPLDGFLVLPSQRQGWDASCSLLLAEWLFPVSACFRRRTATLLLVAEPQCNTRLSLDKGEERDIYFVCPIYSLSCHGKESLWSCYFTLKWHNFYPKPSSCRPDALGCLKWEKLTEYTPHCICRISS